MITEKFVSTWRTWRLAYLDLRVQGCWALADLYADGHNEEKVFTWVANAKEAEKSRKEYKAHALGDAEQMSLGVTGQR
jgi:hypothetical protein